MPQLIDGIAKAAARYQYIYVFVIFLIYCVYARLYQGGAALQTKAEQLFKMFRVCLEHSMDFFTTTFV